MVSCDDTALRTCGTDGLQTCFVILAKSDRRLEVLRQIEDQYFGCIAVADMQFGFRSEL